ncbi:thiolase family protein [Haloarculaceae archaeon H-GB2-1]|nr:thiolase family protein [Haloarculaceae archaeon H-GB1-1]MEA5407938.1 thiolase family protein [Haloarculaceae archaeon H-GB2-1]
MPYENVAIVDVTETAKSRGDVERGDEYRSLEQYHETVVKDLLESAGLDMGDVDGWGTSIPYAPTDQSYPIRLLETLGLSVGWVTTTSDGGVSASSLLAQSAMAVESGMAEVVVCSIADLPRDPYRSAGEDGDSTWDPDPRGSRKQYLRPYGSQGPNEGLAHVARRHMHEYGTTADQLGEIPVVQRYHATRNPLAVFDEPLTKADWQESPMISDPHRLYDCVMRVNGAFGFLLTTRTRAEDLTDHPVFIDGAGFRYNRDDSPRPDVTTSGMKSAGQSAFEQAGIERSDVDFLQL